MQLKTLPILTLSTTIVASEFKCLRQHLGACCDPGFIGDPLHFTNSQSCRLSAPSPLCSSLSKTHILIGLSFQVDQPANFVSTSKTTKRFSHLMVL